MAKIRVAMVGRYPLIDGKPVGGPESVGEVLAKGLVASGEAEVHFVTGIPGLASPKERATGGGVTVHSVPLVRRFGPYTNFFADSRQLRREVAKIDPDIVHVHGTAGPYAYSVLERGYPSVLAVRGIFFREIPFQKGLSRLRWLYPARFERLALKRARNIVFLNRYTNSTVSHLTRPDIRVHYIDNPVDDTFFDLKSDEHAGRILLLAVVRRLKGHEFAIKAVSRLVSEGRDVNLYCVGAPFEADYLAEMKQLISDLRIEDRVHLEDHANRDAVLEHYSKASLLVLPSLIENAPLVVSECMAAGKAIVATPAGGVAEMIEDRKTGRLVPFSNSDAIAEAAAELLDSPALRQKYGQAAGKVAEQRFRQRVSVEKTLKFYREILGDGYRGARE